MKNEVPAAGTLKHFSLPQILNFFKNQKKTGVLTFENENVKKSIYIKDGDAVFAASNQDEDQLEELRGLHRERPDRDPASGARHRAAHGEYRDEAGDAGQIEHGRGADEVPVVDARHGHEGPEAQADPEELAHHDATSGAAHIEVRQRQGAQRDHHAGDGEQHPVDVRQEPSIDVEHQPARPADATRSKKIAL